MYSGTERETGYPLLCQLTPSRDSSDKKMWPNIKIQQQSTSFTVQEPDIPVIKKFYK
jgi:hypothetical protein